MKLLSIAFSLIFIGCLLACNQKYYTYEGENPQSRHRGFTSSEKSMPNEPGKCYAKCLISDQYETNDQKIYLYTGQENDQEFIRHVKKEVQPATTKWVKKKADKNCLSANPDDCLVWCLQEFPAVIEEYYEVLDTSLTKDYGTKFFEVRELVEPGGFTEWREVICHNDITTSLISNIHTQLFELGYDVEEKSPKKISKRMKGALVQYQKDNQLPVGQLDMATLEALGAK